MSATNIISDQLRRGALFPNLDWRVALGYDLSTKQYHAVTLDAELSGTPPVAPLRPPVRIAGILQNAPTQHDEASIRYYGWTLAKYGDTVTAGDLLKVEETGNYDRLVPFVMGTDGHSHAANNTPAVKFLVKVVDLAGTPILGLTSLDFTIEQWFRAGSSISNEPTSTTIVEDSGGGGWYEVSTTTITNIDAPHRISVEAVSADNIVTPAEYQWTPRNTLTGGPVATSYMFCIGQALQSGVADDLGLVMLRPQLF